MALVRMDRGGLVDKDASAGLLRYGLTEPPFPAGTDPEVAWLGEAERQILARLETGVLENQGLLVLVGNVGTGKTMLANVLLQRLGARVTTAKVSYPNFEPDEFLENVRAAWGLEAPTGSREGFYAALPHLLDEVSGRDGRLLLVFDEAQSVRDDLFTEISRLEAVRGNQNPGARVNILLVGQESLNEVLAKPENATLKKKIAVRCTTLPLAPGDVEDYVRHHLTRAGSTSALFTIEAIRMIARGSRGIPRVVNTMADQALLHAARRGARRISGDIVQEATGWPRADRESLRHRYRRALPVHRIAGLAAVACLLAVLVWYLAVVPRAETELSPNRWSKSPPGVTSLPSGGGRTETAVEVAPRMPEPVPAESADRNGIGVARPEPAREQPVERPAPAAVEAGPGPSPGQPVERRDASVAARPEPPFSSAPAPKSPPPIPVPLPPAPSSSAPTPPRGGETTATRAVAAPSPGTVPEPPPAKPEKASTTQSQADADVDPSAIIDWVLQEYPARRQ